MNLNQNTIPASAPEGPADELRVSELLEGMRRPFAMWLSYEAYAAWCLEGVR